MDEKVTPQNPAGKTPQAGQNAGAVSDAEATAAAQRLLENIENTLVEPTALDAPVTKSTPKEEVVEQPKQDGGEQSEYKIESPTVTPAASTPTDERETLASDRPNAKPKFFQETTTYTLQPGDSLWDAARAIEGSDEIDLRDAVHRIEVDPANIDVLRNGLEPGEQLVIPASVVSN